MFSHCLHPSAQALPLSTSSSQQHLEITGHDWLTVDAQNNVDIALKNLVGNGAANAAQHWADRGKLLEKFTIVQDYLDKGEHVVVDKLLVPMD
jgi:DNA cross-link repair 1C protein